MTPLLAAPSTGPANTLHLESQRYICRNAHHAVPAVESHAGEEGKDEGVSLPHHSIHRSQGLTWHQAKEGAIGLCPSMRGRGGQQDDHCTQPQTWDPPAIGQLSIGNSYLMNGLRTQSWSSVNRGSAALCSSLKSCVIVKKQRLSWAL